MRPFLALLLLTGCGSDGAIGAPGKPGGSCTVQQQGPDARIACDDGTITILRSAVGPPGPPGNPSDDGASGSDGPLLRLDEGSGACTGGVTVRAGNDADGDAELDDEEIETSVEICPPAPTCTQLEDLAYFRSSYDLAVWEEAGCSSVPWDVVVNVPGLRDLHTLHRLESVGHQLLVYDTDIESADGLESLREVGVLSLLRNGRLAQVRALSALQTAGELEITGSPALASLEGLENITQTSQLTLDDVGVRDLAPLAALSVSPVALTLRDNRFLERVDLPSTVLGLDVLDIRNNDRLVSLAGLRPGLVGLLFDVRRNPFLPAQEPSDVLESLQRLPQKICLDGNEELCP